MNSFKSMMPQLRWVLLGVVSSLVCITVSEPTLVAIAQEKPTVTQKAAETEVPNPNPVLHQVKLVTTDKGKVLIPAPFTDNLFRSHYGKVINYQALQAEMKKIDQWYRDNGYVLAQIAQPNLSEEGVLTLQIAEGMIEEVQVKFLDTQNRDIDDQGKPIVGKIPPAIILQALNLNKNTVFNRKQAEKGLQQVAELGFFRDVRLSLNPGQAPHNAVVIVNVVEGSGLNESPGKVERDLQQARAKNDRSGEADALKRLAYVYQKMQPEDKDSAKAAEKKKEIQQKARSTYQASLKIYQELNNATQSAILLNNIGYISKELQDDAAAIDAYRQASLLYKQLNHPFLEALSLLNLATHHQDQKAFDRALAANQQALSIFNGQVKSPQTLSADSILTLSNDPRERQGSWNFMGLISRKQGGRVDMRYHIGRNELQSYNLKDVRLGQMIAFINIAGIHHSMGNYPQALQSLESALSLMKTEPNSLDGILQKVSAESPEFGKYIPEFKEMFENVWFSFLYTEMGQAEKAKHYRDRAAAQRSPVVQDLFKKLLNHAQSDAPR